MKNIGFSDGDVFSNSQIFVLILFIFSVFILSFILRKKSNFLQRFIPKESGKFASVQVQKIDNHSSLYKISHDNTVYLVLKSSEGALLLKGTLNEENVDV